MALAACAPRDSRLASAVVDTLPGGIPRVTSTVPTAWTDTSGWKLVELNPIAPATGSPGELINPASMAVDAWGRVYVADQSPAVIKLYDSGGAFIRTIGREGEGPGEFRVAFIAVRGNRLMVHDPQLQRTTLFDTSGAFVRSFHSVGVIWADRVELDAAQRAVLPIPELESGDPSPDIAEVYARFDSLGRLLDTIRAPRVTAEHVWRIVRNGRVRSEISIPFAPVTSVGFAADSGIIYGATSGYSIVSSSGHGDTNRIIQRAWNAAPVADSLRERVFQEIVSGITRRLGEAAVQGFFHLSDIPSTAPAFSTFVADDHGNIWVFRTLEGQQHTIDIFDFSGSWLGAIPRPWRSFSRGGITISGGKIFVSAETTDGHPVIRRWAIQDGQGGQVGQGGQE
jgi:hypothetical protein